MMNKEIEAYMETLLQLSVKRKEEVDTTVSYFISSIFGTCLLEISADEEQLLNKQMREATQLSKSMQVITFTILLMVMTDIATTKGLTEQLESALNLSSRKNSHARWRVNYQNLCEVLPRNIVLELCRFCTGIVMNLIEETDKRN
jgi:hypothetical protein